MSEAEAFDPQARRLCDDGSCLGVVVGGKCNVCGMVVAAADTSADSPRDGGSGQTGSAGPPRDSGSGQTGGSAGSPRDTGSGGTLAAAESAFDEERQLCPDGACIGVLGPDGKCKECGRSAAS